MLFESSEQWWLEGDKIYYNSHIFATRVSFGMYVSVHDGTHDSVVRIMGLS